MNIFLTSDLEQLIQSQVESVKYTLSAEVILTDIRLLEERKRIYKGRFEELQREIMSFRLRYNPEIYRRKILRQILRLMLHQSKKVEF